VPAQQPNEPETISSKVIVNPLGRPERLPAQAGGLDRVGAIVDRLIADVLEHFRDEEAVVAAVGFPGLAEHKLLHAELANKALQLVEDYRVGKQGVGEVFQFLTYDVVTKHMLGADRQFFAYLRPADVQNTGSGSKRRQGQRPA